MSIATKTGDGGDTGLMYNRRVPKHHIRVESYGTLDELNAAIGLAKSFSNEAFITENLHSIQKDLITVMGELATMPEDLERYKKDGYSVTTPQLTAKLDGLVKEIESQKVSFHGWATPGATPCSGALDMARTVCRRAERCVSALQNSGSPVNGEILVFLNRLSDVLWLMARWIETPKAK